jgi:AGZA family xanthine/uracil permease-like MFS transporter
MSIPRYRWAAPGDINAFFGLMLDNVAGLLLAVGLLSEVFAFPAEFSLRHMVPGTAIGVLVGDLLLTILAFHVARAKGRNDLTAMPLGLDTPSTFGMVFFVLGPAFLDARQHLPVEAAAERAWHIGVCSIFLSGLFKLGCAFGSGWVRRVVPRAGLLGSLAAIALVLISFLPMLEIARVPAAGFAALAVILTALVARLHLPMRVPGALAGLAIGGVIYFGMYATGTLGTSLEGPAYPRVWFPSEWLAAFRCEWLGALDDSIPYLPIVIPLALATVVGGIDCTESAAAVGDEYHTGTIVGVEAVATILAALCGGVIQTTPFIGHPAYKAMGGRAAYTLATALFVGAAGTVGFFSELYAVIPKAAVFPILVFIGLEITSQSYHATPQRHYPAVALACVPAMAALVMAFADRLLPLALGGPSASAADLDQLAARDPVLAKDLQTVRMLSAGFIITSLLWSAALASIIDRRLGRAGCYLFVAAVLSLFGVIHSPLKGSPMVVPWTADSFPRIAAGQTPICMAGGYAVAAVILLGWGAWRARQPVEEAASRP